MVAAAKTATFVSRGDESGTDAKEKAFGKQQLLHLKALLGMFLLVKEWLLF
ncbi:hypothetical protein [endosymbiont 'TC1' of Trimyema compressum]|uniref:hypothetical protein n=1 Tax=endosymbiont 'TC1' of Trimyema compressum TaxID=243899 RepID=UPI000B05A11C|nr:hypothetical protein [endosymbiont 'TC1' of Trimyema compressum]